MHTVLLILTVLILIEAGLKVYHRIKYRLPQQYFDQLLKLNHHLYPEIMVRRAKLTPPVHHAL